MKIKERFAAAFKAFRTGQVINRLALGVEVKQCSKCERVAAQCTECSIYHAYKEIISMPDCNDCGAARDCPMKVGLGEHTRINCYHHKPMDGEIEK